MDTLTTAAAKIQELYNDTDFRLSYLLKVGKPLDSVEQFVQSIEDGDITTEDVFFNHIDKVSIGLDYKLSVFWDDNAEYFDMENYHPPSEKKLPSGGAWIKNQAKNLKHTSDYKGILGNARIVEILHELNKETNAEIASLGSIKTGMPLHMRIHYSTDQNTLELYSEKVMLSSVLVKYYADMLQNNDTCFLTDTLEAKLAKSWADANKISQTCMYYVSVCVGERIYVLFLNFKKDSVLNANQYLFVIKKIAELNKLITQEKKWYQFKKKIVMD